MRNSIVSVLALCGLVFAEEVKVYVSLDREHSEQVLARFEKETGIKVAATYDTEATKTVGLVRKLITEKADPQADVYWNNEIATTIKLKEHGVLQSYRSPVAADIPDVFKDKDGMYTGFAARARVLIVNTDLVGPDEMPTSMWDLTRPQWKGKTCMARPETGTTAAHASALYVADEKMADDYFDKLIANDVTWLTGNAHCMREVAAGRFAFGWTDTDDFNVARIQGRPVTMVYPDKDRPIALGGRQPLGVMYIPNTLVLIKGAKNPDAGKKLIDWLLRPETEKMLAHSATAQIPVRPGVEVPPHVRRPDQVGEIMEVDWDRAGKEWDKWVDHVRGKLEGAGAGASFALTWVVVGVAVVAMLGILVLKKATGEPQ